MEHDGRPVSLLASVTSEGEARLCASLGADIIDAKDPAAGALGALPMDTVRAIRKAVPEHVPVSATIGDLAADPEAVADAVLAMAGTGVDFVKVGIWPGGDVGRMLARLGRLSLGETRLVGVLLADREAGSGLIQQMAAAGFAGVMLDTADKTSGALPDLLAPSALEAFVKAVHRFGLFAGLAGSLRAAHVPHLLGLGADVLGFRGGLCDQGQRTAAIDADAVRAVRRAIPRAAKAAAGSCSADARGAIARSEPERAL